MASTASRREWRHRTIPMIVCAAGSAVAPVAVGFLVTGGCLAKGKTFMHFARPVAMRYVTHAHRP